LQLIHANEKLEAFVYQASQDLGGPVANLLGLTRLLEQYLPTEASQAEEMQQVLGMMQTSIKQFSHTLLRLEEIGPKSSQASEPHELLNLAAVIKSVRLDLLPQLTASAGRLEIEVAGKGQLVFAPQHVRSVLYNLISNGLKYRHPDRAPVVRVHSHRELGKLFISVQDNGLGLDEQQ
jgi:signal transduction histidine kinase